MEQSKSYLVPRLPLLPVSIVAKFLEVSEKLCTLAYLNKAWHKFVYSGYAWEQLNIERGQRGWRDDIRFFINKFLAKFSEHALIRRLDFSSLTLPQIQNQEQEFCEWLIQFGFVNHLALYESPHIKNAALNKVLQEATAPAFKHLRSLELDAQATKLLFSLGCEFLSHTPALQTISISANVSRIPTDMTYQDYKALLHKLPQLRYLNISGNFNAGHKNIRSFFEDLPQHSPKLTQISFSGSQFHVLSFLLNQEREYWEHNLTHFKYMPPPNAAYPTDEYQLFKFIALEELHLTRCHVKHEGISNLVSRCKKLKVLYLKDVITDNLVISKHPELQSISLVSTFKTFGLKLGDLPSLSQITADFHYAQFKIDSEIPLKLKQFHLEALNESKSSDLSMLKIEALDLAISSLRSMEITYCQIKKAASSLDRLTFAFMASASLTTVAILSSFSKLERLHSLTFQPRIYNPDETALIHSLFPQLVKLHLDLNHLQNITGFLPLTIKHPYLRRLKISASSPLKGYSKDYELHLCLGEECVKLETVQIEGIISTNLELKTNIKQLNLDSPLSNLKISTEVGIQSVKQNSMSQVFDFPLMQRLVLLKPSSIKLFPFTQRFRSLRFLQMDAIVKFNLREVSELLRNAVNLETLKIRFYPQQRPKKLYKFILNHAKLRTLILRDGHENFEEIIIGAKCEKLEILEICWFKNVVLTLQGANEPKLLLVQTQLIEKQ